MLWSFLFIILKLLNHFMCASKTIVSVYISLYLPFFCCSLFSRNLWCRLYVRSIEVRCMMFREWEIFCVSVSVYVVTNHSDFICADKFKLFFVDFYSCFCMCVCVINVIKHFFSSRFYFFGFPISSVRVSFWFHFRISSHQMRAAQTTSNLFDALQADV